MTLEHILTTLFPLELQHKSLTLHSKPVVLKVVDIDPQGSIGPSEGSISIQGVEWGSLNGQGVYE